MIGHEIKITKLGMGNGDLVADIGRKFLRFPVVQLVRLLQVATSLFEMAQSLKNDGPVQMSFGIRIRNGQSFVELLQGRFRITQHCQAQAGFVMDIREPGVHFHYRIEQLQRRLIVGPLPGTDASLDELFR